MTTRDPHKPTLRRLITPRKRRELDRTPDIRLERLIELLDVALDHLTEEPLCAAIRRFIQSAPKHAEWYGERRANILLDDIEFAAKLFRYAGVDQARFFEEYPTYAEKLSRAPSYLA